MEFLVSFLGIDCSSLIKSLGDNISDALFAGDAHHITQPSQEGRGAYLAMSRALQQVCLKSHLFSKFCLMDCKVVLWC